MFDSIPVFKPNQALTARHLNDLREFLDHENRLTRRALIGIGVLCGFALDTDANGRVHISKGVAITSEGYVIAEGSIVCDRVRRYEVPVPTGDGILPEQAAEARYPFLFPDGETQIDAWELLTSDASVPESEALTSGFLGDKTVMLFLECVEESLKNCDVNDCSDKGAELQFTLRRLLVRRADADAMMAREAEIAAFPADRANHPGLALPYLRVEDLGLARNGIATYPALFARVLQIAGRFAADLPKVLRDCWSAYRYLLADMYPEDRLLDGPFPDDYFGNVWGNLSVQPFQVQYFYAYMLDAAAAYNEFAALARVFTAECLPDPARFPRHVLLGDPVARPLGFVATVASPAEFAAYNPLAASTGFGVRPNPPRRRTPWTPAGHGDRREELRSAFHRLTLLAHAFQLRGLLAEEIRVTPSRHDAAPLGERCIPLYYAFTVQSDLFRVWSPRKTRENLLSTVYSHRFSARNADHPYLFRIDGENFHAIGGHLGKDLARVMGELIVHKRVLGLDFAIEPVWMGLSLANDERGIAGDSASRQRALEAARRLILCRMGDFEIVLLALLAALFAFLVYVVRGVGRQRTIDHARFAQASLGAVATRGTAPETMIAPSAAGRELAAEDIARLVSLARIDAVRRPEVLGFSGLRLMPEERREIREKSGVLLNRFRAGTVEKGAATRDLSEGAGEGSLGAFYLSVAGAAGGSLFDRVRDRAARLDLGNAERSVVERIYNAVALIDSAETLMQRASVSSLAEFDAAGFETAYADFSDKLTVYAQTAPIDPGNTDRASAATNLALADYAPAVAAQTVMFSGAGLLGEVQRRIAAIFADLTLEGYARRHPGLEHRGGVPSGGTLVLAYVSKTELARLMSEAAPRLDRLTGALNLAAPGGPIAAGMAEAVSEVLRTAGPNSNDPLSEFVVLADFCLPSKCCDSDCSDIVLEGGLPERLFDLDGRSRMAVEPIIPNGASERGGGRLPLNATDIRSLLVEIGVRPGHFTDRLAVERVGQPPASPPQPEERPAAERDTARPRPEPVRPAAPGRLRGRVVGAGPRGDQPIAGAAITAVNTETDETARVTARNGAFELRLPPGRYRITAAARGFRSSTRTITVEAAQEVEAELRLRQAA